MVVRSSPSSLALGTGVRRDDMLVPVACCRRLAGLAPLLEAAESGELTIRVPNLAFAEDSRLVYDEGIWARRPTPVPVVEAPPRPPRAATPGFGRGVVSVTRSAPQYEKLILLFRSDSSDSAPSSSSSSSSVGGTSDGIAALDKARVRVISCMWMIPSRGFATSPMSQVSICHCVNDKVSFTDDVFIP